MITSNFAWSQLFSFIEVHNLFDKVNYDIYNDIKEIYPNGNVEPLKGFYDIKSNTVVIIANQHTGVDSIYKTYQHETFGHFGINNLSVGQKTSLLNSIGGQINHKHCDFKEIVDFINNSNDYRNKPIKHKAEEIFAFIAQDTKVDLNHKFIPFENKLDGSTKEKIKKIIQNLAAGIRENKLSLQKDNFNEKSQDKGMSR